MVRKSGHAGLVKKKVIVKKDGKTFERYQWVKAGEDEPKEKPSKKEIKGKGSFKIDSKINFLGKDLTIEKVSESEKTVKLSDGKVYTFGAIDKGNKIKKVEKKVKKSSIKDLKINKKIKKIEQISQFGEDGFVFKSQFNNEKISINKLELSKAVNVGIQSGESGYAFTPKSYDKENRKFEGDVVNDLDEWIRDREKNLRDELKSFYGELGF